MKLATYKDGSRDGQLVVVSRDLSTAHYAAGIATRLQQVLDDWNFLSPQLEDLFVTLNQGKARHAFAFEPRLCMAPLPRAYQWVEAATASAPAVAAMPNAADTPNAPVQAIQAEPVLAQGGSDGFLGPCDDAWFGSANWGIDLAGSLAALTGDVAMGASPEQGLDGVRLLLLANSWRLRGLQPGEQAQGAGPLHSWPPAAFGPVAVTPDELGEAWARGRVQLTLQCAINGRKLGLCEAGEVPFHFGQLVATLSKTRPVRAGTLVGLGPVRHRDSARGFSCLADQRAHEAAQHGAPKTPWLALGDRVRVEVKGRDGLSLFGAIEQRVVGPGMAEETDGFAPSVVDEVVPFPADDTAAQAAGHAAAASAGLEPLTSGAGPESAPSDVQSQSGSPA